DLTRPKPLLPFGSRPPGGLGRCLLAIVLDLDLGTASGIPHGLGSLVGFLADHDFFLGASLLGNDRLLAVRGYVDRPIFECFAVPRAKRPVNRPAFDCDALLTQGDAFLDRMLDGVDPHAHMTLLEYALPDFQLLLVNGD